MTTTERDEKNTAKAEMWNESESVIEFARTLGITPARASAWATNARKRGIELKRFPRGRKKGQTYASVADGGENVQA